MADRKKMVASFDEALQARDRKERNAKLAQEMLGTDPKKLAQEMLGKNRRISTPRATATPVSLASRRSTSLPRSHAAPPRNPRQPSHLSRPAMGLPIDDNYRPKAHDTITITSSDPASDAKSNGYARGEPVNGGAELNIRGAAGGPYIVRAQNFAPGTTAADIDSVMQNIGGQMNYCKLVTSTPTVIAEMSFVDRTGAEKVIDMFNNKKADGRVLYVYFENSTQPAANGRSRRQPPPAEEEPLPAIVDTVGDTEMEIDEHAEAREAENRQREQRRGRDEREPVIPGGPRQTEMDDYLTQPRRDQPHQDRRYGGYGGGDRRFDNGRGRYRGEGRMYSDNMRRGGGQSYRP
ncbi:hypothetical protein LTR36_000755 [Oleoguttula mirabilis]|uniref:RRM domain-containing protein n=1 Tax=Oleoguttula mirabilis TaxID=1507867 RepID=A0AAV9JTC6_9PEZI|nr:hypothetical protein LTR36_000755 [Oleoguttula mirabilis]